MGNPERRETIVGHFGQAAQSVARVLRKARLREYWTSFHQETCGRRRLTGTEKPDLSESGFSCLLGFGGRVSSSVRSSSLEAKRWSNSAAPGIACLQCTCS